VRDIEGEDALRGIAETWALLLNCGKFCGFHEEMRTYKPWEEDSFRLPMFKRIDELLGTLANC